MTKKLTFQEVAAQAASCGFELLKYAGSTNAYGSTYRCKNGHTWSAKHNNVVSANKTGCPVCAKSAAKMTQKDVGDAVTAEGFTLVEIHGEVLGQKTKITSACKKGHLRTGRLGAIIYAKKPCPACLQEARKVDLKGINERLLSKGYTLVAWEESTRKKGTFSCRCGESWVSRVNSVLQGQSNCPGCYEGGLRGDKPAVFYIYELRQGCRIRYGYGISGAFARRDAEHRRNVEAEGWRIRLMKVIEFNLGKDAVRFEKTVKVKFKSPAAMPRGFKTESIMPANLPALLALSDAI